MRNHLVRELKAIWFKNNFNTRFNLVSWWRKKIKIEILLCPLSLSQFIEILYFHLKVEREGSLHSNMLTKELVHHFEGREGVD